jgi:hypothetical protein
LFSGVSGPRRRRRTGDAIPNEDHEMSKAILRLQPLADRDLPSVTVLEAGGVLTVRGDQWANAVVITDDGTDAAGAVTVEVDGQTYTSQAAVARIRVCGWNGADSVEYRLTGDLATTRRVVAYLGNQDDTFHADLTGNVLAGGILSFWVCGGNGEDSLSVGGTGGGVADGARMDVRLFGGNGKDVVGVDLTGVWVGTANVVLCGGNGVDTVSADLTAAAGSTGTVRARVWGGNGVDTLTLLATKAVAEDTGTFDAYVNGGNGKDVFDVSDGVRVADAPR